MKSLGPGSFTEEFYHIFKEKNNTNIPETLNN